MTAAACIPTWSFRGETSLGEETEVYPFASLGAAPQDKKYAGERTMLVIGARNVIREYVTMQPGTHGGGGVTRVGDQACSWSAATSPMTARSVTT